ncbi:hypothetical protein AB0H71_15270 [Nocardia sp. NPDC050697]|uniref:hypothetical protein n=1 Tax=Nocardia sp. NPDC050697 TaxID=3155158 RepID=UPI00340228FF
MPPPHDFDAFLATYRARPSTPNRTLPAAGAAVLAFAAAATAVAVARGSDDPEGGAPPLVSALTSDAPASIAVPSPVLPGYRVVAAPDRDAAYDVPAGWHVAPADTVAGFGRAPDALTGKGYATDGRDYCPGSTRTVAFLTAADEQDPAAAATAIGAKAARLAYADPGAAAPAEPLRSLDGGQQGMFVETRGRIARPAPGCAAEYSVYTWAAPSTNGSFVMVIAADTGVPQALDAAGAKRVFSSIRPYEP